MIDWLRCFFGWHRWKTHQHNVEASDEARVTIVVAWRQCRRCAKSELIHILR